MIHWSLFACSGGCPTSTCGRHCVGMHWPLLPYVFWFATDVGRVWTQGKILVTSSCAYPLIEISCKVLTVGMCLVSCGSMCFYQHGFSLCGVYPQRTVLILTICCTFFDASSVVFVICKILFKWGVHLHVMGIVLISINVVIGATMIYLRSVIPPPTLDAVPTEADTEEDTEKLLANEEKNKFAPSQCRLLKDIPFGFGQLCTMEFGFILMFMSVNMTRSNLFLGLLDPFFESIDDNRDGKYVNLATLMIPAGAVFVLAVEKIITYCGGAGSSIVVHLLGFVYGSLMFVPVLWVKLGPGSGLGYSLGKGLGQYEGLGLG